MSKLLLIRGLPGSGKSTMAQGYQFRSDATWYHFEADMFMVDVESGLYTFRPELLKYAHEWCLGQCARVLAMRNGSSVVVSNTFTRKWEMQPYQRLADEFGVEFEYITATGGNGVSVHGVPESTIQAMRDRWEE